MKQRAKEEAETRKLDMITTDKIQLGEQQPESDHFIESKGSGTGYMEDRHFRDAKGWFSYQMKNNGKNASFLYLLYFDANNNRTLNIEINGKKLLLKTWKESPEPYLNIWSFQYRIQKRTKKIFP